ncbi:MAG: ATP-binding protein [Acidobacteriota bacterium]
MLRSRFLWKLYAGYAVLILSTAALIGGLVAKRVQEETLADADQRLLAVAILVRDIVRDHDERGELPQLGDRLATLEERIAVGLSVVDFDGEVLAGSEGDPPGQSYAQRPEVQLAVEEGLGAATRWSATSSGTMRYLALRLEHGGEPFATVRTSLPLTALQDRLDSVRRVVLLGAAGASAVALLIGFLYSRRITRPLQEMAEAAELIAGGAYGQKVRSSSRDELGKLARAFNAMSAKLRKSYVELDTDREKLTAILASMEEGLVAVDRDERIMHVNSVAGRLLRIEPDEATGQPIWEMTRLRDISEVLRETLERGDAVERAVRLPGTRDRVLELRAAPLVVDGDGVGAVLLLEDQTQLRHLETMRQDFVANVSHELKTPVTAIRGMVETLLDDPDIEPARRERFLHRVVSQVERMGNLVTDLLSLARLESDSTILDIHSMDLREPIYASARSLLHASERRDVRIELQLSDDPVMVFGDEEALQQAITNLLDNALKFSPKGGSVQVRTVVDRHLAAVEVEDRGVGIEAHHRERLFERFYRVDKARSRALGGTGLGLAIVKHISRALGGNVSVDSVPGRGSTFRIHLPYSSDIGRQR